MMYRLLTNFAQAAGNSTTGNPGAYGWWDTLVFIVLTWAVLLMFHITLTTTVRRKNFTLVSYIFLSVTTIVVLPVAVITGVVAFAMTFIACIGLWIVGILWTKHFTDGFTNVKLSKRLARIAKKDKLWAEQYLIDTATTVFSRYQNDVAKGDLKAMSPYVLPELIDRTGCMVEVFSRLGWRNILQETIIRKVRVWGIDYQTDDGKDICVMWLDVKTKTNMPDVLVSRHLSDDEYSFIEAWTFQRVGEAWMLADVGQILARKASASITDFAAENNLYYWADTGWLLLPTGGSLLKNSKFSGGNEYGAGELTDHVFGRYKDSLLQIFTLELTKESYIEEGYTWPGTRLVGVLTLPKAYGGILVRPVKDKLLGQNRLFAGVPGTYTKHEFEWPDFNRRYEVYATDADLLAAFELVNPDFMAYLYDTGVPITVEVVNDTVYVYTSDREKRVVNAKSYRTHLEIMHRVYRELRL